MVLQSSGPESASPQGKLSQVHLILQGPPSPHVWQGLCIPGHCMAGLMPFTVKFRQEASGPLWAFHQLVLLPTPILRAPFFPLRGAESLHFHTVLP